MTDLVSAEFVRTRPQLVATELEKFTRDDVAGFLRELDDDLAVSLMARLSSRLLTLVLEDVSPERLARLLIHAAPRDAYAVVAHISADQYQSVIAAADPEDESAVRDLFGIPARTVAMQTTRQFVRVFCDQTCGSVLRELAATDLEDQTPIFAVTADLVYRGVVPVLEILHEVNHDRNVEDFLLEVPPLKAKASVNSVLSLQDWDLHPVLPVVNDEYLLQGAVAIRDLRRVESFAKGGHQEHTGYTLFELYLNMCADFLDMLVGNRRT